MQKFNFVNLFLRATRSKPEAGKLQSIGARSDKISKTRDNDAEILSKLLPTKESGSNRCYLKKPRNVMKTLDKVLFLFVHKNCLI